MATRSEAGYDVNGCAGGAAESRSAERLLRPRSKLALAQHPLITIAHIPDAILTVGPVVRKQPLDGVSTTGDVPVHSTRQELDTLSN